MSSPTTTELLDNAARSTLAVVALSMLGVLAVIIGLAFFFFMAATDANAGEPYYAGTGAYASAHHHRRSVNRRHNPTSGRSLVAYINSRLMQYVHRTGKCGGRGREVLATYYWQGSRTATGERFNPNGYTVAVKKNSGIAFGTHLTVTNPHNNRTVTVRVNDRGPATIAEIDLSRGAARALGLEQSSYVCLAGA